MGWSGKIDHTIAALGLAFDSRIELIDDNFTVKCISDLEIIEDGFFPDWGPEARVSIAGPRWELDHEKLKMGKFIMKSANQEK